MAIDPSISLGFRPPQIAPLAIQTPLDRYQKMLTLRHLMTQGQLGQANLAQTELENRNLQEQYQRGTSLRELLGRGGALTEAEIYGAGGPKLGGEYLKTQAEIASEKAQKAIREFDLNAKKAEMLGNIGQGILDADTPEAYEFGIKHAEHSQLITPETAAQLRTQKYNDPQTKAQLQIFVRKSIDAADQWKEKRDQAKFELEKPGLQADAFRKEFGVAMQQAPDNQADWTIWRESLKPEFRRFISPMFSPLAREQAIRTGAPPEQQLTDIRLRETAAEQARRNRQLALPNQAGDFARIIGDPNATPQEKAAAHESMNMLAGLAVASRPEPRPPRPQQLIAGLTPAQNSTVQSIATRLDNHKTVQDYTVQAGRYQSMKNIMARGFGGGGDLALIYEFMRALDPQSVVRESEYAAAAKSGNIFAGALARFNGYLKETGGSLPDALKKEFLGIIEEKMGVARNQADDVFKAFGERIDTVTGEPGSYKRYLTDYANLFETQGDTGAKSYPGAPPVGHVEIDANGVPRKYTGGNHRDAKNWAVQPKR